MNRRWATTLIAAASLLSGGQALSEPCAPATANSAIVSSVQDGRTFKLADGREMRLAGIETAGRSGDALRRLVEDQAIGLPSGSTTDRYGRLTGFPVLPGADRTIQEALLDQGEAMVSARMDDKACAAALFAAERTARAARRGLWADPNFAPLSSENLSALEAARGRFALVEGKVLSVRESGATIYMNFGRRWTRDFTVTVLKRQQRTFAAAGLDVKQLEGRRIRVRGFIERRGGPIIDAVAPEQIELID